MVASRCCSAGYKLGVAVQLAAAMVAFQLTPCSFCHQLALCLITDTSTGSAACMHSCKCASPSACCAFACLLNYLMPCMSAAPADYKTALNAVPEGDEAARHDALHACHQRSADKLLKLCFDNGGIYIKLGQHIGQLVRPCRDGLADQA